MTSRATKVEPGGEKECFPCQGLGYFMQFDPGDGRRLEDRTCRACDGTGRYKPREIPMPGYFTNMDGNNPRQG